MKDVLKLNEISPLVKTVFADKYQMVDKSENPEAIILRSFKMQGYDLPESVKCVGRAGAGTNNIPCDEYAKRGVVVFNTPGANANAVKELVLSALFLASRSISEGIAWANTLSDGEKTVAEQVEKGKKAFAGCEILGKTLGIFGLGAIGREVADSAKALGMEVVGYDPFVKEIDGIKVVATPEELYGLADYITFHVPLNDSTRGMINKDAIEKMKDGVKVLNFSRGEIVVNSDIISACESGKVSKYICDFPVAELLNKKNIVCVPHLGASTEEAEDNCAVMVAKEIVDFVENGNIVNSVNYPKVVLNGNYAHKILVLFDSAKQSAENIAKAFKAEKYVSGDKKGMGAVLMGVAELTDYNADGIKKVYKF